MRRREPPIGGASLTWTAVLVQHKMSEFMGRIETTMFGRFELIEKYVWLAIAPAGKRINISCVLGQRKYTNTFCL